MREYRAVQTDGRSADAWWVRRDEGRRRAQVSWMAVLGRAGRRALRWMGDRPRLETALFGLFIGIGVCWPWLGNRSVFLLDWAIGPRPLLAPRAVFGLDGGLLAGVLGNMLSASLVRLLGAPGTWLPLLAFFPIAAAGIGGLLGSRQARLAGAALYVCNPWVFNRLYAGQVLLLLGYALLPFAVLSALLAVRRGARLAALIAPVLWWAALSALAPHYAWIFGLCLVVVVVTQRPFSWRLVLWLLGAVAGFVALSAYLLLPHLAAHLPVQVGVSELALFRTSSLPHVGLFVTTAALYGFWRTMPGPVLPSSVDPAWLVLAGAIVALALVGFWSRLRPWPSWQDDGRREGERQLARALVVLGLAGWLLALGGQGPTGWLYRWAFVHIPFFDVMREPQKWLMLLVLAYAVGLGWGVERLAARSASNERCVLEPGSRRTRRLWVAGGLGVLLALAYAPTLFDGLAGQVAPSGLPAAFAKANRLMGKGQGRVLVLPWRLYGPWPGSGGRTIASPMGSTFERRALVADDPEVGLQALPVTSLRQRFVERLVDSGPVSGSFAAAVAPLGIEYVVLVRTVGSRQLDWLGKQPGLEVVMKGRALEVWRNLDYRGQGSRVGGGAVQELSPVAYRVPAGRGGEVEIQAAYQPGWWLDGRAGEPSPEGTVEFDVGSAGGIAHFEPWVWVRVGFGVSAGMLVLASGVAIWDRRRSLGRGAD